MKTLKNIAEIALATALTTASGCAVTNNLQNTEENRTHMQEIAETNKGRVTREVLALQNDIAHRTWTLGDCKDKKSALICTAPKRKDITLMLDAVPYNLSVGFFIALNIFDRRFKVAYVSQPGGIATNSEFQESLRQNKIPFKTVITENEQGISYLRIGDLRVHAPAIALIASSDQCIIGRNNGDVLAVKCK